MTISKLISVLFPLGAAPAAAIPASAQARNQVAGTWRIVSAQAEHEGTVTYPFGPAPIGLLIFGDDLHFAETIQDPGGPKVTITWRRVTPASEHASRARLTRRPNNLEHGR